MRAGHQQPSEGERRHQAGGGATPEDVSLDALGEAGEVPALALAALLAPLVLRGVWRQDRLILLFLCSPGLAYLLHTVGYLEHVAYVIALVGMGAIRLRPAWRYPIAVGAGLASVLVHEASLFITVPLLLFAALMAEPRRLGWLITASMALTLLGATVALSEETVRTRTEIEALGTSMKQCASFPPREDALAVLGRSSAESLAVTTHWWKSGMVSGCFWPSLAWCVPFAWAMGLALCQTLRGERVRILCGLAAGVAPLALHAVGVDAMRWNALVVMNMYLACAIAAEAVPAERRPTAPLAWLVPLMLAGLVAEYPFFDGYRIRQAPYTGAVADILRPAAM